MGSVSEDGKLTVAATRAASGQLVTDEMIDAWHESLDRDEWPSDWVNVSDVVHGKPPAESDSIVEIARDIERSRVMIAELRAKIQEQVEQLGET